MVEFESSLCQIVGSGSRFSCGSDPVNLIAGSATLHHLIRLIFIFMAQLPCEIFLDPVCLDVVGSGSIFFS